MKLKFSQVWYGFLHDDLPVSKLFILFLSAFRHFITRKVFHPADLAILLFYRWCSWSMGGTVGFFFLSRDLMLLKKQTEQEETSSKSAVSGAHSLLRWVTPLYTTNGACLNVCGL